MKKVTLLPLLCMKRVAVLSMLFTLFPVSSPAQTEQTEPAAKAELSLSLDRAVQIALAPDGNTRVALAEEAIREAKAHSAQSRASLLPDLEGSASASSRTYNLATLGLQTIPNRPFPLLLGPFTLVDTRAYFRQTIVNMASIREFQASRASVAASQADNTSMQDRVAAQVARLYLAALRADARVETEQANVSLAEALHKLSSDRAAAGEGMKIDATRARVQLAQARQRLLQAHTERDRAHLDLLKALNLKLDTALKLTETLAVVPVSTASPEQALATALESRADWKVQQRREEAARLAESAAKFERLPSLAGFADYGAIGGGTNHMLPTRTYGVLLQVPVFNGGRREADRAESSSKLRQEIIRGKDLRQQIELEIRQALDALRSAEEQVKVAEEGLNLAEDELAQARRRYEAGIALNLEVTDAQNHLAQARESRLDALFNYNLARIDLGEATGTIRGMVRATP